MLQYSQPIKSTRRCVRFSDHVSSSDSDDDDDDVAKRHTRIESSDSDSCEQLSARTKHTVHTVKSADESHSDSHHSDGSHSDSHHSDSSQGDDSPSQFLDHEAEEVWHSDEGCGSDDMQDFIVDDDAVEEWGSCDPDEVDDNSVKVAQSVSPKRCHGRKLLDTSSESDEEVNGTGVAYNMYRCGL